MILEFRIKGDSFPRWVEWMNTNAPSWAMWDDSGHPPWATDDDKKKQFGQGTRFTPEGNALAITMLKKDIRAALVEGKAPPQYAIKVNISDFNQGWKARAEWPSECRVIG